MPLKHGFSDFPTMIGMNSKQNKTISHNF